MTVLHTIEGEIDASGRFRPIEAGVKVPEGRALLTLLEPRNDEAALLAQPALAEDWLRFEEDEAWAHLQPGR